MQDEKIEAMKQDYEQIQIPEELRAKVISSIAKARAEAEGEGRQEVEGRIDMKETMEHTPAEKIQKGKKAKERQRTSKILRFASKTAGTAAAAMLVITVMANSNASVAYAMSDIPVLGTIAKVVTFRNYERQDHKMEAKIQVPEIAVEDQEGQVLKEATEDLNQKIQDYTDEIIAMYEQDVAAAVEAGYEEESVLDVDVNYTVITDSDKLFSIRFDQTIIMADGTENVQIYHMDKTTGEGIQLDGLFQAGTDYVTPISENIKEQMRTQMAADEMVSYWLEDEMEEWNFKEIARMRPSMSMKQDIW